MAMSEIDKALTWIQKNIKYLLSKLDFSQIRQRGLTYR